MNCSVTLRGVDITTVPNNHFKSKHSSLRRRFDLMMSPEVFFLTLCPLLLSAYQAPEDKEDIFTSRSCPAFLVFDNAAYVADMTVELPCHCKPADALSVVWYYQKHLGTKNTKVLTDFSGTAITDSSKVGREANLHDRFSIRLFSLIIFRAQPSDSGHYVCGTASGQFFYGYDVDVQVIRNVLFPWNLEQTAEAQTNLEQTGIFLKSDPSETFRVFTSYWPWSACDRCGVPGEQVRVGLCYVVSEYLHVRYIREIRNVTSCGSSAVPLRFGLSGADYGAELSVRRCKSSCPPKPPVNPQRQALLEFLGYGKEASSGLLVYSHNHPANTDLVLSCPKARPQHTVAWDKGSTPLYRSQYMEGVDTNPRVFIDLGHHLHFRPVTMEDKGTYYCWIQGRKAAEIRLGVYTRLGPQRSLSDPESLFGLSVILLCYAGLTAIFLFIISLRFICDLITERRASF
ncbi:Ig-like V-type domain-containing protein FAM187A [Neoarius graeffei]|uniref:Ig-like V-type domain-containing protein FAM187A n=1 Tax=Neoarius graeffei TaxID=443677 RepID=UPI00298D124F|nr:Ig-like V-type domain-containing protein FAM187A [Neoarius graeffei]